MLASRALGAQGVKAVIALFDFAYLMHPFVSLGVTAWILKRVNRLHLVVFPALSMATVTESTIGYPVGMVNFTLSLFWPLLALTVFRRPASKTELAVLIVFAVFMLFSYEPSMLAFAALQLYFLLVPLRQEQPIFWRSLDEQIEFFRFYAMATVAIFSAVALNIGRLNEKQSIWICRVLAVLVGCVALYFVTGPSDLYAGYLARTTAMPLTMILAGTFYLMRNSARNRGLETVVAVAFVTATAHNVRQTLDWREGVLLFDKLLSEVDRCGRIGELEVPPRVSPFLMRPQAAVSLSVILGGSAKVERMLFAHPRLDVPPYSQDPCKDLRNGIISFSGARKWPTKGRGILDFSAFTERSHD